MGLPPDGEGEGHPFLAPLSQGEHGLSSKGGDRGLPLVAPLSKREEGEGMSLALCSVGEVGSLAFPPLWRKAHAFPHRLSQRESKESAWAFAIRSSL